MTFSNMGDDAVGPTPSNVGKNLRHPWLLRPRAASTRFFVRTLWLSHTGDPCRHDLPHNLPSKGSFARSATARSLRYATHHVTYLRNQITFHLRVSRNRGSASRHTRSGFATSTYASDTFFTRCAAC